MARDRILLPDWHVTALRINVCHHSNLCLHSQVCSKLTPKTEASDHRLQAHLECAIRHHGDRYNHDYDCHHTATINSFLIPIDRAVDTLSKSPKIGVSSHYVIAKLGLRKGTPADLWSGAIDETALLCSHPRPPTAITHFSRQSNRSHSPTTNRLADRPKSQAKVISQLPVGLFGLLLNLCLFEHLSDHVASWQIEFKLTQRRFIQMGLSDRPCFIEWIH